MTRYRIRRQVLVPLTLTFIVLVSAFVYASYQIRLDDYANSLDNRYQRVQSILTSLLQNRSLTMLSITEFIADRHRFQEAMIQKDRDALILHGATLFERISAGQNITHFYFHDAAGSTYLRIYDPENTRESAPRHTKLSAMETGKPSWGLELGGSGTFTLRIVYPWFIEGELVGYIELGQEIDSILHELQSITQIDFLIALYKSALNQQEWQDGMTLLGRDGHWEMLPDMVVIDQTLAIPEELVQEIMAADSLYSDYGKTLQIHDSTLLARAFVLKDVAGDHVGEFVIFKDMTLEVSSFRQFTARVVLFSSALCMGLFVFAFSVLGRVERRLQHAHLLLEQEVDNQARANLQLEREVRERARAEENLRVLNENLEERVEERTAKLHELNLDLEKAYNELQAQQATILQQDKMACIGQLAAGVAHDINNPIGFVSGNLEVLQKYHGIFTQYLEKEAHFLAESPQMAATIAKLRADCRVEAIMGDFRDILDESLEGTERVSRIVQNLKGFARPEGSEIQMTDIHECLESTIGIINNEIRYKAELIRDYGDLPLIPCYPQQLNQVFMNLLINAAQAIETWGTITIGTRADEKHVVISISDTGCGIPEEQMEKIFEPFFTTKPSGIGTGLGLSIVYDIISRHNGDMQIHSAPGSGTTFTLRLPRDGIAP